MSQNVENIIHIVTRAVIVKDGQLLVCVGEKNQYVFLPGGHVEPQESALFALERELQEELGLQAKVKRFLGCLEYAYQDVTKTTIYNHVITRSRPLCHMHEINLIFEVDVPELTAKVIPQSPEDHTVFAWIPLLSDEKEVHFLPKNLLAYLSQWLTVDYAGAFISRWEK